MAYEEHLPLSVSDDERYRLLINAITDYAIYMLDPTGRVTSWNPGAERLKGYTAGEILGENFSRFYTKGDREAGIPARNLRIAATNGKCESEGWRVRKDGSQFWASVVIDPIRDPAGHLVGFAKITRDLTERREAQRALEQAREALLQSQKMEVVGQLTGGIAHDFNNFLAAILGSLELLRRRIRDDQRACDLLDNATKGAQRGAALTQRMLAFARRQEIKPRSVDLQELIGGMMGLLQQSLGPAIVTEFEIPPGLSPVLTDPNQFESALLNLMVNARDAMPDGGTITVTAREATVDADELAGPEPGRYVCLAVKDTGEGMDEETLAHATEPFFTTKSDGKGTGLGLPMVHVLAQQSGGRLVLESRKGVGTTATLWLRAESEGAPHAPEDVHADPADPDVARPLVALAVDDDSLVLLNIVAMLEDMGHTVFEAHSGREALDILRSTPVDLVITDQAMPRMSGVQLVRTIGREWPHLPTILISGYAELPSEAYCGINRLAKPFRQEQLAQAIADALRAAAPH
ncbi:MAG TPA: PAS domain S-box protein [Stellaceae bacterium]|jgi:PAS domain S-box-containing protein